MAIKAPKAHRDRIKKELKNAGVSNYGLLKMESRYLPEIIGAKEHIMASAYGLSNNFSGMLVATNLRIIYTERKPFYKVLDEVPYDMISGVRYNLRGNRANLILHSRIGDYELRFVNKKAAENFVDYIESVRVSMAESNSN